MIVSFPGVQRSGLSVAAHGRNTSTKAGAAAAAEVTAAAAAAAVEQHQ